MYNLKVENYVSFGGLSFSFEYLFIYLAVLGLRCSMRDLLVAACGI